MTTTEQTMLPKLFIREWAKHKGMGQKILAEKMDTTEATVSRLLSGQRKMTLEWLAAFSAALGCAPSDMFTPPSGGMAPIQGDSQILETLRRIEGLNEQDITIALSIISNAIRVNAASQSQTQPDDQSELASPHREPKP